MKKYKSDVPVSWRGVLKDVESVLNLRAERAFDCVWRVHRDRVHNYPEELEQDLRQALAACEDVFEQYVLLDSLRRFLNYKPKTREQLGLSEFYYFYMANKKNPCGADLKAGSTEICEQSE